MAPVGDTTVHFDRGEWRVGKTRCDLEGSAARLATRHSALGRELLRDMEPTPADIRRKENPSCFFGKVR